MFSCEFCKISKNTFSTKHLRTTASVCCRYETNPFLSQVSQVISKPAGEHTRIRIDTYTNHGFKKRSGGDSFRVLLHGPDTLAASVFDLHNGSYDALALLITPGIYKLQVILDYSLCNGFRDPPTEWYVRGKMLVKSKNL